MSDRVVENAFVVMGVAIVIVVVGTCCYLASRVESIQREAVKRGYAEWYATTEGRQPTHWRWKEASGDE